MVSDEAIKRCVATCKRHPNGVVFDDAFFPLTVAYKQHHGRVAYDACEVWSWVGVYLDAIGAEISQEDLDFIDRINSANVKIIVKR